MIVKTIRCTFLGVKTTDENDPSIYRDYFLDYSHEKWKGSGGALFKFINNNKRYCLTVYESDGLGILLNYDVWDVSANRGVESWYSLGEKNLVHKFTEVADELCYPVGCFVKPDEAWMALVYFFQDPEVVPKSLAWVKSDDIPWPDDW